MVGLLGETKLTKQLKIESIETGKKWWVRAKLINGQTWFYPSFEELFYMIRMICEAEDLKYPKIGQQGWTMVQDFLYDACEPSMTWEELEDKYQLLR